MVSTKMMIVFMVASFCLAIHSFPIQTTNIPFVFPMLGMAAPNIPNPPSLFAKNSLPYAKWALMRYNKTGKKFHGLSFQS